MIRFRLLTGFAVATLSWGFLAHSDGLDVDSDPAVARVHTETSPQRQVSGVVFFIAIDAPAGVAAIGSRHSFDLRDVVQTGRVGFYLGRSGKRVASSSAFLIPPGLPFFAPGGNIRDDFAVYALESAPVGVSLLEIETQRIPEVGARVRISGAPSDGPDDEENLFGRVAEVTQLRIEVDLDSHSDLRGWGGAPVISVESGRVIGILEGTAPHGSIPRVTVAPIAGVQMALDNRTASDPGRPFAEFRAAPSAQLSDIPTRPAQSNSKPNALPSATRPPTRLPAEPETQVHLDIEHPHDGSAASETGCGTFVAGRATALRGELRKFDVALVLDTSQSTRDMTGADINGNGVIGMPQTGKFSPFFGSGSTDPEDSILAAEVAAARQLLRGFDPRSTRVAVIKFSDSPPAITVAPLTHEFSRIEFALDTIVRSDPAGYTDMAAGVDQGTRELLGLPGSRSEKNSEAEKLIFFFTDGQPTLPYPNSARDNTRAVLRAASRARRADVRIHSFAIGPEALAGPIATVEMAALTDGDFTPVRHPGDLTQVIDEIEIANLSDIRLRNTTTDEEASPFRVSPDGAWAGLIKLTPGVNAIEIIARSTDGTEALETLSLVLDPEIQPRQIPRDLALRRNLLLEDCLRSIKEVRISAEAARAKQVRKELLIEIERERSKARQRAAQQRKELRIEAEEFRREDDESTP